MTTVLIQSPFANLRNVENALTAAGHEVVSTLDPGVVAESMRVVLPGVGSFDAAQRWLEETGLSEALTFAVARGTWLLGICVGHQMLFERSCEGAGARGLGFFEGSVERLPGRVPVPQLGWNHVSSREDAFVRNGDFYFANSFAAAPGRDAVATARYGVRFTAAARRDRVLGVQFHPERSSHAGLEFLRRFRELSQ